MEAILNNAHELSKGQPGVSPQLRLPGEDDGYPSDALHGPTGDTRTRPSTKPKAKTSRGTLLSTVGVVFLIGSVGCMGYAQRAQLQRLPVIRGLVSKASTTFRHKPVITAANVSPGLRHAHPMLLVPPLAGDATMHILGMERAGKPVANPVTPVTSKLAAVEPSAENSKPTMALPSLALGSAQAQLQQFDAFQAAVQPGSVSHSRALAAAPKPPPTSVATPGLPAPPAKPSTPLPQQPANGTQKVVGPTAPQLPAPPVQHAAQTALNPTAAAAALKAAPMTDQQQLDVLHLVTELGVLVRDQRSEIASLNDQVVSLSGEMNTRLTDFDRRLSVAEAKGAIDAAMGAVDATATPLMNRAVAGGQPAKVVQQVPTSVLSPAPAPLVRSVSDYDIQAASPGLAMLTTHDDGGASIQVGVGDTVPGIGRVISIYQSGTEWVIKTDHGMIQ